MKKLLFPLIWCCADLLSPALAAPLDALLTANRNPVARQVEIETAYDLVNNTVDVFHLRANDSAYAGTNVGDYHGAHVRLGMALTPRLWLDGAFWERRIDYHSDVEKIKSWQLAGQYKLVAGEGAMPGIAVRLGAWGDYSGQMTKSSPTVVGNQTLNTLSASSPKDKQLQFDVIGTSTVFTGTELTGFLGAGISDVTVGSVSGTATHGACNYNVMVGETETVGTLAGTCNADIVLQRFSVQNSAYGINVKKDVNYNASYIQAGTMLKWHTEDEAWKVRAGYQYQYWHRQNVDNTVSSKGGTPYTSNHIFIGDISYALFSHASIFIRGQYMVHQFVGEIPFVYNAMTASRFDRRYGIASTGIIFTF